VINNQGGGIFQMLPIARTLAGDPLFEKVVLTPQRVDLGLLAAAHGISHQQVTDPATFCALIQTLPAGIRILEVPSDGLAESRWRQDLFQRLSQPQF